MAEPDAAIATFEPGFTTWVKTWELLVKKLLSPLYTTVIGCDPTGKELVLKVAFPPLRFPVPIDVDPS